MNRLALTLVPLLLLACGREPAAPTTDPAAGFLATSGWQEIVVPVEWVFYNQCLGENLHGTGTSCLSRNTVTTATGARLSTHVRLAEDWRLEGLTTHDIWLSEPGTHNQVVETASGDFLVVEERFVFENQTTGVVLDWPARITFVTNANGDVKVDRFQFDDCTLR